jgi:Ser/Thr protein kinase RdoA (MazF antagonist)
MDSWLDLNTVNLLGRVDSRIDKDDLVKKAARAYGLGSVIKFRQIHEGFEDYNIKLTTAKGTFLFKVFSQHKSFRHVKDNVKGLRLFAAAGVQVPRLIQQKSGEYLFYYETKEASALGTMMEFFPGKSFFKWQAEPTQEEILFLTKQMAFINHTDFKPLGIYDPWNVKNVVFEYEKKERFLSAADMKLAQPYIAFCRTIDWSKCSKGTIHGDLQRSNIMKDKTGAVKVVDFSCMDYHALVVELAVFIALFCWNPIQAMKREQTLQLYRLVLGEYQQHRKLRPYDLKLLPQLIGSTYLSNALAASYELRGKGNTSQETKYWVQLGSTGMKLTTELLLPLSQAV